MLNENVKTVVSTVTDGMVKIARAGAAVIICYEIATRIFGGTSLIGTIIRTKSTKAVIRSFHDELSEEKCTADIAKKIVNTVNNRVETIE